MRKHQDALDKLGNIDMDWQCNEDGQYSSSTDLLKDNYVEEFATLQELVQRDKPALLVQVWRGGEGEPYMCSDCFSEVPHMFLGMWHFCPICGKRMGSRSE